MALENRANFYSRVIVSLAYEELGVKLKLQSANRGARYLSLGFRLSNPAKLDAVLRLADPVALQTKTPAVIAQRLPEMPGLITYQFELQHGYWQSYTRADVNGLGVGLAESRRQIDFSFDDAPHTLVAGETKCGKSVTVASILTGICETYARDQVQLVVIDPNHDYDDLANVHNLAVPVANSMREIDRALAWANQVFTARRSGNVKDAHRMLVVVDEAETTLGDERRLAIAQDIARGGRKYNVNLLVSTQKPKQSNLPDLLNQLGSRYVGKCDNAQTSHLLTGHAGLQAHKLTRGGDFLHINGAIDRFQVAMPTRSDFDRLPRAEVAWPTLEMEDIHIVEPKEPGRPRTEIEPKTLAYYIVHQLVFRDVSQRVAREELGLGKDLHYRHREFARELIEEIQRLYTLMRKGT